ncbi:diguanylate phosphodiesterase (plasmid) [Salmonella enterica subsp. enterica serovar Typhimurium]|nr:diguanylate phosphodiesterase [Salmonella enterica subsp. enterica serovar Typhimurium]
MRFAVDDFGTGHAGPASTVADRMIARTVSLARCVGGPGHCRRGGDYLQGWHCGAPMPFGLFHFRLTQKSQPAFG